MTIAERSLDDYQRAAARTLWRDDTGDNEPLRNLLCALGLCGEAGEVAELLKKHYGHGHDLDRQALAKELGDVLWYVAALATRFSLSLDAIASENIAKLQARYPEGFSEERSKNRAL